MTEHCVIYEQASDGSWSARAADHPVFAVGDTKEEARREIRSAIAFYLDYLAERGESVPDAQIEVGTVTV